MLVIMATFAPAESIFSKGGDIITKKRNRFYNDTFKYIICLKDWGIFVDNTNEKED